MTSEPHFQLEKVVNFPGHSQNLAFCVLIWSIILYFLERALLTRKSNKLIPNAMQNIVSLYIQKKKKKLGYIYF